MKIEQLAKSYKIDQSGIDIIRQSRIAFLVGITSAGKDTIQKRLLMNSDYHSVVSHTTRKPRSNNGVMEQDGVSYHFVTFDEMSDLLISHKMVEINKFGENYYGASVKEFSDANEQNKIAVTDLDVNGIASFYEIAPSNISAVFIVPPDYETWLGRVKNRYDTLELFESDWRVRRDIAISELTHALSVPYYRFVINDDLDRAVKVVDKITREGSNSFGRGDDEARLRARDLLESIKSTS